MRILLVDDDPRVLNMARRFLTRWGHWVYGLTDSVQALDLVRRRGDEFDVVVTDHLMPVLSGLELAGEIRRHCPRLPIVIATGSMDPSLLHVSRLAGVSERILKPFTSGDLERSIRRATSRPARPNSA